jgi:mono/diheme cytochrome c family protein
MNRLRNLLCVASSWVFVAVGWAGDGSLVSQAPSSTAARRNPFEGQERARLSGAKLFARECVSCHGENGAGGVGKAPPLRHSAIREAFPGALFWVLRHGSMQNGMPSFAHLPETQRWQIITWLTGPPEH